MTLKKKFLFHIKRSWIKPETENISWGIQSIIKDEENNVHHARESLYAAELHTTGYLLALWQSFLRDFFATLPREGTVHRSDHHQRPSIFLPGEMHNGNVGRTTVVGSFMSSYSSEAHLTGSPRLLESKMIIN